MPYADFLTIPFLLQLAAAPAVQCSVPKAPVIEIKPTTKKVEFVLSKTSEQLEALKSDTVSPYAPGTDTATGGLRQDTPEIKMEIKWGTMHYTARDVVCLWYDKINVTITLNPKIYIASDGEFRNEKCHAAIKEHELKHVAVDREVVNRYALRLGKAIQEAVNEAGAMGPYNMHEFDAAQGRLVAHIESVMEAQELHLHTEMAKRQAQVDTIEEYERVNAICDAHN